ncbi:hypothetical protein RHSIM_Rhsim09G0084300 [Rhododendron simsii]|uniref:Uncharacterized protein n=1 Tax=Rhododendron simsii TaxID=118357 RepID=A0A834GEU9_RHOSS|nr:hypothetical protein RHSIM_Rhsim09G0084300 [Rhododendron simsii]
MLFQISYLVMFAYISLTLGDTPHFSSFCISSKVLGLPRYNHVFWFQHFVANSMASTNATRGGLSASKVTAEEEREGGFLPEEKVEGGEGGEGLIGGREKIMGDDSGGLSASKATAEEKSSTAPFPEKVL